MKEIFEYKIINPNAYNYNYEKEFNKLGKKGWELITTMNNMFFFKRRINEVKMVLS